MDFFWGKSPKKRGGVISGPKKITADFFVFLPVYFGLKFWKKSQKMGGEGVISNKKNHCKYTSIYAKNYEIRSYNCVTP